MSEAASEKNTVLMEKIVSLCKGRGFIFQSAEIYGGLNGCWDYGPLGAELKRNLKEFWWRKNVQEREDILARGYPRVRISLREDILALLYTAIDRRL